MSPDPPKSQASEPSGQDADVIRFEPPAPVRLVDAEDVVIDEPVLRRDQLPPDTRAAIPSPWHEGQFLLGHVRGQDDMLVFVVGVSFGQLEWSEEGGWVCNGLVQQRHVWGALGNLASEDARKKSFTERVTRRSAKSRNK